MKGVMRFGQLPRQKGKPKPKGQSCPTLAATAQGFKTTFMTSGSWKAGGATGKEEHPLKKKLGLKQGSRTKGLLLKACARALIKGNYQSKRASLSQRAKAAQPWQPLHKGSRPHSRPVLWTTFREGVFGDALDSWEARPRGQGNAPSSRGTSRAVGLTTTRQNDCEGALVI
ncbi:hypothetical protein MTR67_026058 [Solanum verrucosum]|uniref:Uncharacterized protein n=1 Tax=Solanum verrucosum TaxID=315347 RepID=A0AAF0R222_SOLVR|nr:hypothetical protein MTR67_026058 [Solanum verrucosum]